MKNNFNKLNLFLELYQKARLPSCYLKVAYVDQNIFVNDKMADKVNFLVHSLILSPNYLEYSINNKDFKLNTIKQANKGYAIDISEMSSLQAYMETQMSRNSRKMIRQSIRRLENSFKITYRMFYDDISKVEYYELFDHLRVMLDKRFEKKNIEDDNLSQWSQIRHNFYHDLINKNASIFVIYNSEVPIGISLNYLSNNIIFSWISSYDMNYSKFNLGHVDLYKHVEWCFENNYRVMELGYGDFDYKNKWCNNIYNFEHHILYKRNSIKGVLFGKIEYCRVYIKEFLKHKGIHVFLKKFKKKLT